MIRIDNVNKKFKNKELFRNFNYTIDDGMFLCIFGESGCGKSTLLNMIGSLEKIDEGDITFVYDDKTYSVKSDKIFIRQKIVSYIFQNYALLNDETVLNNLLFAMQTLKISKSEKYNLIEKGLKSVNLYDKINSYIYELSGGEQQRIAIIRAQLNPSSVILADEPTGNLDEKNKNIIIEDLKKMNDAGKTIIVVTHDEEFKRIADRVIEL